MKEQNVNKANKEFLISSLLFFPLVLYIAFLEAKVTALKKDITISNKKKQSQKKTARSEH